MRTFVAIDLSDSIKKRLCRLQEKLRVACPKLRWVEPEKMHLTLKFLGEITDQQVEPVCLALDAVAAECEPFEIGIAGAGVFGARGPVKVAWCGVRDADGKLADCQSRCEASLERLGFPPERRPFSPHLTLARNRNPHISDQIRSAIDGVRDIDFGELSVKRFRFYQSTLTKQGPIYTAMSTHSFG